MFEMLVDDPSVVETNRDGCFQFGGFLLNEAIQSFFPAICRMMSINISISIIGRQKVKNNRFLI